MSLNRIETHVDLIDFHVGSPVLPRRSSVSEINIDYDSENLIDTELPVFERKLQNQSSYKNNSQSRRNSIDVEDILINIDSDEYDRDSIDGEKVETDEFLNVCEGVIIDNRNNVESTLPVDNFEALLVLKNLDDLLNATLEESEDVTNGNSNDFETNEDSEDLDDDTQYIIEECLEDLDNYLQAIDTYDSESNFSDGSCEYSSSNDVNLQGDEDLQPEFNEELERTKLRQIEENYRKFVATGIVNRGYIDHENNVTNFTQDAHLRRPSSACAVPSQLFKRKQALKASTVNGARRERPRLIRRKSLTENYIAPQARTLTRTSGPDGDTTAPEITGRLSRDVSRERHAHASADRCTGTVIVEPLHRQCKADSSSTSAVVDEPVPSGSCGTTASSSPWLRSSMRRLQQVTLPNVDRPDVVVNLENGDTCRLEVPDDTSPMSAPSRLPPLAPSSDQSTRSRSRNQVSQQPTGRARSSSASSRSRRRRSVSSSGTSVASSVDSTLSRMPPLEGTVNASNAEDSAANNNNQRRYAFLFSGVAYGSIKLQALKALEAGRAEEKTKKRAERDIRLIEERRLAAERDFEQIIEVFTPPPKVDQPKTKVKVEIGEPLVQSSSNLMLNAEDVGVAPQCESSYETVYPNDDSSEVRSDYSETTESFALKENDTEIDLSNKAIDLSVDGLATPAESNDSSGEIFQEKEDSGYVLQDFGEIPIFSPEDESCRIPPEK